MLGICGAHCDECDLFKNSKCAGCIEAKGCPFGKKCFVAKYIEIGGKAKFELLKNELINEINFLQIDGMAKITDLYPLNGSFINLEYLLPNGNCVKYLDDNEIYLGNQVECVFNDDSLKKCFGIVCNMNFILVCEYEENGLNPELLIYKKR